MLDWTLFNDVFVQSTENLFGYIEQFTTQLGYTVHGGRDKNDTMYLVCLPEKRTTGICLVAHCDTIIRKDGVELYYEGGILRNRRGVLGADDRAGVYGLLHTIAFTDHRPVLMFTNFEESGGLGVKALCDDKRLHDWLIEYDVRLFIELDRANNNEYVYYSWDIPDETRDFAESFGFHEAVGSYSDVADLTEATTIPHLNLSIGYKNQHGKNELLSVPDMMRTISALDMMLYYEVPQVYIEDEPEPEYTASPYQGWASTYMLSSDELEEDDWDLAPPKIKASSLEYNTRGSCFICHGRHMLHDTLLVCQECYDYSMAVGRR